MLLKVQVHLNDICHFCSSDVKTDLELAKFKLNHILTGGEDKQCRKEFCVWFNL